MKTIEIDDELYAYIASQTKHIGESASEILHRLLIDEPGVITTVVSAATVKAQTVAETVNVAPTETVSKPTKAAKALAPAVSNPPAAATHGAPASKADEELLLNNISKTALAKFDKRVDQFLYILQQVYLQHPTDFSQVETIIGKNRKYFASSKEALLNTGSSTNPKAIPDSGYWVVTNNNTAKKLAMLSQVLQILGYSDKVVNTVTENFES
ncbi:SeqA protein [Alteromonas gilva]|uniref:Negative modulator of initiation of replication n=1 Tax=Alteromonas gilva TaxID=2987522 RepID=A0ABT5L6N3_9ALTE|nr:SeqA protein [Alteromonas gilva]MDC8831502.1 SeqA protein [Alteromonas gilva]